MDCYGVVKYSQAAQVDDKKTKLKKKKTLKSIASGQKSLS
jgi:hypothetical protein